MATASSGLTALEGNRPNIRVTARRTTGIRVAPPTSTISFRSSARSWLSRRARSTGSRSRASRPAALASNSSALISASKLWSRQVTAMVAVAWSVSARRARSAATRRRSRKVASCLSLTAQSLPSFSRNSSIKSSLKSSPPSRLSPVEARTSTTPSKISSTETSKVPPPKSNTRNRVSSSSSWMP